MSDLEPTPRPNKRVQQREATRAALIALGLRRIPIRGYAATSIRELVAGSELTKNAFDYHFPNKAEYFLALVDALTGPPGAWAALARAKPAATLEEAVGEVIAASGDAAGWGAWLLAMSDFARTEGHVPVYRARLTAFYEHWIAEVAGWVEVLQEQGLVAGHEDPRRLAEMAYATVEGHIVHAAMYGRGADVVQAAVARVLRG